MLNLEQRLNACLQQACPVSRPQHASHCVRSLACPGSCRRRLWREQAPWHGLLIHREQRASISHTRWRLERLLPQVSEAPALWRSPTMQLDSALKLEHVCLQILEEAVEAQAPHHSPVIDKTFTRTLR